MRGAISWADDEAPGTRDKIPVQPESLGYLLTQRKVIGLAVGLGSYNYVFYLLLTWLPSYLSMVLHVDLLHSFLYTSVPWLFATLMDILVGGWLVNALIQRGWDASRVRKFILVGGTACGLGIVGAANPHSAHQALIWISISIGGLSAASPVGWSIPSLIAQQKQRREGGRHCQLFQSAFGYRGAHRHRLSGNGAAILCVGLRPAGDLSGLWNCRLPIPARQD